ncbi:hypothetical protein QCA50_007821 [Cerrena zonata]|uniref:Uncharacterized protein n=1 Tax=Cerrena zonata TaxID=2478898 RepID=A0AAW0G6Q1_9APHY
MIRGRDDGGNPLWSSPPPTYAPLCGPIAKGNGTTMNLFDTFVSMEVREVKEAGSSPAEGAVAGEVLDIESFKFWLSCSDRNTVIEDV